MKNKIVIAALFLLPALSGCNTTEPLLYLCSDPNAPKNSYRIKWTDACFSAKKLYNNDGYDIETKTANT